MRDLEFIFLILAAIYVWECVGWFQRGSVAYLNFWGKTWQLAHPAALLGNQSGGIILANPLPPLGGIFVGSQSPLSISPEGVFGYVAQCVNPGWRPAQTAKYFPFDAIKKIDVRTRQVRVNGELLLKADSPAMARRLAEQLQSLVKLPLAERRTKLREMLHATLDAKTIRNRLEEFRTRTRVLRWLANALFVYVFLALPIILWQFGLKQTWIELAAGLLGLTTAIAILFNRAHRASYPEAGEERFTQTIVVLLSPATAIRARDALSRPLLESFHPLAVAQVLLPVDKFNEFARRVLLEIAFPCLPICPSNEPGPQATERAARESLQEALKEFLKRNGLDPVALMKPPVPADESCRSYCPRCGAQFVTMEATCQDCGGMPALPLQKA